jgi:hypothetical protein
MHDRTGEDESKYVEFTSDEKYGSRKKDESQLSPTYANVVNKEADRTLLSLVKASPGLEGFVVSHVGKEKKNL